MNSREETGMYLAVILAYVLAAVGIGWIFALWGNERSKRKKKGEHSSGKEILKKRG